MALTGFVKLMLGLGVGESGCRRKGFVKDGDLAVCSATLPNDGVDLAYTSLALYPGFGSGVERWACAIPVDEELLLL
jgi:hypothetical protein